MRRFLSVHKSQVRGLGAVLHNNEDLEPEVNAFLEEIRSTCASVPQFDFSIRWENMSSDILAYTYTYYTPSASYWVPANVFEIYFNPKVPWSNGTCAEAPWRHYDLKTTVMHEVLHGLGFLSTVGSDKTSFPTNYDLMLKDAHGSTLVNNAGIFDGSFGQSVYIDNVRIYNPSVFNSGSSLSHVHASSRLMSYAQTECQQHLDFDTRVILNRLGYQCDQGAKRLQGSTNSTGMIVAVIGGVAAVIAIVVAAIACRGNKKESELKTPLLQSKKKLLF